MIVYSVHPVNTRPDKEEQLTLELLEAIDRRSDITQRHLARDLGVALGLANSYLKRCVRMGWVKISDAPANRYLYYLTPRGFAEKSRLTAAYLTGSFDFYRRASESLIRTYRECVRHGQRKIILCGRSELAEIAYLRSLETDVSIVALWDPAPGGRRFFSVAVVADLDAAPPFDVALVTDLKRPHRTSARLVRILGKDMVRCPDVLASVATS